MVQVFHQTTDDGPFDPRQGLVSTLDEIDISPDLVIHKHRHSAGGYSAAGLVDRSEYLSSC